MKHSICSFNKFNFRGFKTYRNDNERGTAIIIKNEIKHYEIPINNLDSLEATAINIKTHNTEITIISTYNSPSIQFNKNDYDKILKSSPRIIAAGDFNAKHKSWGSRVNNTLGNKLLKYCDQRNLFIHAPNEFTHYPISKNGKPKSRMSLILL